MDQKQCNTCKQIFTIDTHFRSSYKTETNNCLTCRNKMKKLKAKQTLHRQNVSLISAKESEKICKRCYKSYPIQNFTSSVKNETNTCITCRNNATKSRNNVNSRPSRRKEIYLRIKKDLIQKSNGCVICGIRDDDILQFDHINPKEKLFNISDWTNQPKKSEQDLLDEISKTRFLCIFHHRIHSVDQIKNKFESYSYSSNKDAIQQLNRKKENETKVKQIKLEYGECAICRRIVSEEEFSGFDFDHLDIYVKRKCIPQLIKCSWEYTILPEIQKCRLLCANCHVKWTRNQRYERVKREWILPKKIKYKNIGGSKLNIEDVREIRRRKIEEKLENKELGKIYNTSRRQISAIVTNECWKDA